MEEHKETYAEAIRHFYTSVTSKMNSIGGYNWQSRGEISKTEAEFISKSPKKNRASKDFIKILDEELVLNEAIRAGVLKHDGVSGDMAFKSLVWALQSK